MTIINYMIAFIFITIAETILIAWSITLFISNVTYLICVHIVYIIALRVKEVV